MKNQSFVAAIVVFFLGLVDPTGAWAAPMPPEKITGATLPPLEQSWPQITLRLDLRNLMGPDDSGKLPKTDLTAKKSLQSAIASSFFVTNHNG